MKSISHNLFSKKAVAKKNKKKIRNQGFQGRGGNKYHQNDYHTKLKEGNSIANIAIRINKYYKSNIEPIIQYGILVYGCCKYTSLLPILMMQKKILKFIYFRKRHDSSDDLFIQNGILTVFELHL